MTVRNGAPDAHGARVRGIFSEIAQRYDLFNALSSFGIYRSWLTRMARVAACTAEDRVLDVAGERPALVDSRQTFLLTRACLAARESADTGELFRF